MFTSLKIAIKRAWIRPSRIGVTQGGDPVDRSGELAIDRAVLEAVSVSPVFMAAVDARLRKEGIHRRVTRDLFTFEQTTSSKAKFSVKSLGSSNDSLIVKHACAAIAELEAHLYRMERDNAVSAVSTDSEEILRAKCHHLWDALKPDRLVKEFGRVIEVTGLPDFEPAVVAGTIDIDQLLKIRETDECRLFRGLLNRSSTLDEAELRRVTGDLRARIGEKLKTGTGKGLRWLATSAIGAIPGAGVALGPLASAADTFLVEAMFKTSGVVNFLGTQYPSLFTKQGVLKHPTGPRLNAVGGNRVKSE